MAQINLLKQTAPNRNLGESTPQLLVRIFVGALLLLLIYYAWLLFDSSHVDSQIVQEQAKVNAAKQQALAMQDRNELLTRQQQIQSLQGLIGAHVYWSQLFPELARVTLKTASYSSIRAGEADQISLDVTVPSLADLDKYMQIFNYPQFNQNFNEIRISGYSKVQSQSATSVQFEVTMQYNPALLRYQPTPGN